MNTNNKKWCDTCQDNVLFNPFIDYKVDDEVLTFKGVSVTVKDAKIAVCHVCGTELPDDNLDGEIMKVAVTLWEEKTNEKLI